MDRRAISPPTRFDSLINNPYATLLESLYAILWNHDGFESFLSSLKDQAHSFSAALMVVPRDSRKKHWGWSAGIPANFEGWPQESRDTNIHQMRSLHGDIEGFIAASLCLKSVEIIDSVSDAVKPWFQEQAIVDAACLLIEYSEDEYLFLVLMRNESEGVFNEGDIHQLNFLVPFIKRTAQLYVKIHRQQKTHDALIGAVRSLSQATIVLNELLEVQYINPAAEVALESSPVLEIINNKLVIQEPVAYQQLLAEVADLTGLADKTTLNARGTVTIPQGKQSISITLTSAAGKIRINHSKMVLVQIFHPDRPLLKAGYIQKVLNISQTEAVLCQLLVNGYSLKEIANKRDVSIHTVREQIRQIYQKTGYKRQAELVAGIMHAAA